MSTLRHVSTVTSLWTKPRSEAGDMDEDRSREQDGKLDRPGHLGRQVWRGLPEALQTQPTGLRIPFLKDVHGTHMGHTGIASNTENMEQEQCRQCARESVCCRIHCEILNLTTMHSER